MFLEVILNLRIIWPKSDNEGRARRGTKSKFPWNPSQVLWPHSRFFPSHGDKKCWMYTARCHNLVVRRLYTFIFMAQIESNESKACLQISAFVGRFFSSSWIYCSIYNGEDISRQIKKRSPVEIRVALSSELEIMWIFLHVGRKGYYRKSSGCDVY